VDVLTKYHSFSYTVFHSVVALCLVLSPFKGIIDCPGPISGFFLHDFCHLPLVKFCVPTEGHFRPGRCR
jgi:hypothetical protein